MAAAGPTARSAVSGAACPRAKRASPRGTSLAHPGGMRPSRLSARLAPAALLLLALLPGTLRSLSRKPSRAAPCAPAGRGAPPRHWLGCDGDEGPARELTGGERLLSGLALDPNTATAQDLAAVPGLSPRLAEAIVADRARSGRFARPEHLGRVRGIGPARLERALPYLATPP